MRAVVRSGLPRFRVVVGRLRGRFQAPDVLSRPCHRCARLLEVHRAQVRDRAWAVDGDGHCTAVLKAIMVSLNEETHRSTPFAPVVPKSGLERIRGFRRRIGDMTDTLIPEGFRRLEVPDQFVDLSGRSGSRAKARRCGSACRWSPVTAIHWAGRMAGPGHGGRHGDGRGLRPRDRHPLAPSDDFAQHQFPVRARLGQWLEAARTPAHAELCFCNCDLGVRRRDRAGRHGRLQDSSSTKLPRTSAKVMGKWVIFRSSGRWFGR